MYDPELDEVVREATVPNTDLLIQVRSYNGGPEKVAINRVVEKRGEVSTGRISCILRDRWDDPVYDQ